MSHASNKCGWLLAVHCGAGHYGTSYEAAYISLLQSTLETTHRLIDCSTSPPTATEIAVHLLHTFEHSTLTNAGLGSNLTEKGQVECEASVVCGQTHLVSCCGAVRGVKEPSALALRLLEQLKQDELNSKFAFGRQPPVVVVGEHTRQLAREFNLETAPEDTKELERYQVTKKTYEFWTKWHRRLQENMECNGKEMRLDTVGAICMDPKGNVAAALSSGGVAYKVPGRLGLAGCPRMGCDASNGRKSVKRSQKRKRGAQCDVKNAFAIACTGRGEHFIRSNFVGKLTERLTRSADLERGLRKTFIRASEENDGIGIEGGVLAFVSTNKVKTEEGEEIRRIQLGAAFTTPCMGVGFLRYDGNGKPVVKVQILRQPVSRKSARQKQSLSIHVSNL
ncbi:putative peptidase T2, asparaginase 2, nucleophile aminohydrolase [Plasmopara halstedii]